jgi:predicted MFS family arabinose efflux permease
VLAGLSSVNATVYEPAAAAITPETVPESDLAAANALRNMVDNIAIIAGPVLGALLLVVSPAPVVFLVNGLTFAVSGVVVSRMSVRSTPVDVTDAGTAGPLKQMLVGVQAITGSATAATLVAYSVIASFVYGVDTVQFVVLSEERLGTGADGFGYLLAGLGIGGIVAAGLVNRMAAWPRLGSVILLGMAVYCLPTLLFLVVDNPVAAAAIQVVRGAGTLVVDVLAITALQRSLPKEVLGRVFGAYFSGVLLAISLGALVTPFVISNLSLDASIWMAGALLPALCLLGLPWLRRMDSMNVARLAVIEPRVLVLERLGILTEASRAMLERLATDAREVEVPAGTVVIREGDEADAFYVLVDGEVGVRARGEAAQERELPAMTSGAYFGEIGLLEHIPRTATVTATLPSRLLRIDGDAFVDALTDVPASTALLEGARSRLARTHPNRRPAAQPAPAGPAAAGPAAVGPAAVGLEPSGSVPAQPQQALLDDRDSEVSAGAEEPPGGQPPAP